jgi:magnesium chelatase family protein
MLDRFDIHVKVPEIDYKKINNTNIESSESIKERVNFARNIQKKRYENYSFYSNSELTPNLIEKFCVLDKESNKLLIDFLEELKLSFRTYAKILKVSRTIADLNGRENINIDDVLEAIQYRNLEEK